jgi:predicted acyltransferase
MPTSRLLSLDVFRGITIAGMVLVNNPGSWEHIYWPLEHAQWHGWTPTDLVFPFFLFIVGVAITLSLGSRVETAGSKRDLYLKIIKRTLIIFAVGLFLNAFPYFSLAELRIPGVLQRIAVCYFFASIIFLNTRARTQILIAIGLLLIYWFLLKFIPAPGFAAGDLTKEGSLPSFVDRVVFGKHVCSPDIGCARKSRAWKRSRACLLQGRCWLRSAGAGTRSSQSTKLCGPARTCFLRAGWRCSFSHFVTG